MMHGKGEETWEEGSMYIGNYFKGMKHGEGIYIWKDGSKYSG